MKGSTPLITGRDALLSLEDSIEIRKALEAVENYEFQIARIHQERGTPDGADEDDDISVLSDEK